MGRRLHLGHAQPSGTAQRRLGLPYIANNVPHKYPRGQRTSATSYAVWPKGRMIGVEAEDHGEFTMIPIVPPGKRLVINAVTLRTGWVKVGVLGVNGRGLSDCVPIVGDQHDARVTWRGSDEMGVGDGKPVTLRVEMQQARIYGLEFSEMTSLRRRRPECELVLFTPVAASAWNSQRRFSE